MLLHGSQYLDITCNAHNQHNARGDLMILTFHVPSLASGQGIKIIMLYRYSIVRSYSKK